MAVAQFEKDYRSIMRRFHRPFEAKVIKVLKELDQLAKRLSAKGLQPDARKSQTTKMADALKRMKRVFLEDSKERKKQHTEKLQTLKNKEEAPVVTRTFRGLTSGLSALERAVNRHCSTMDGKGDKPQELPPGRFTTDYLQAMTKNGAKALPAVQQALKKLDDTREPAKVTPLYKEAKAALDTQIQDVETQTRASKDAKAKDQLTRLSADLLKLREEMKKFDRHVFLIQRMKDG